MASFRHGTGVCLFHCQAYFCGASDFFSSFVSFLFLIMLERGRSWWYEGRYEGDEAFLQPVYFIYFFLSLGLEYEFTQYYPLQKIFKIHPDLTSKICRLKSCANSIRATCEPYVKLDMMLSWLGFTERICCILWYTSISDSSILRRSKLVPSRIFPRFGPLFATLFRTRVGQASVGFRLIILQP